MTQHTQPVVAAQHQQHQQLQTSTTQQQHQLATTSNSSNNNAINNSSNPNISTSITTTNNNQTQTVAVQQHTNNNNNNNNSNYQSQQQNAAGSQMFNPQLPPANLYVPAHGIPAHHHQQHHHQPGAMYQTMIPAALPSNVYVNNVTANVNLHGWPHTVPHGTWLHSSGGQHYIHGDLPPEQGAPVLQAMGTMPVSVPTGNALTGPVISPNTAVVSGARGSRRGRGRGGTSGSRRGDYNMQRHPQSEGSPVPQHSVQSNQQELQQQQQSDAQQMMTALPASYVPHAQYAAHAHQYPYTYPTFFSPQQHVIHPGQSTAAQQATGAPLYFSPMPVYNGPPMYNCSYYLPPVMNQSEYQYGEEMAIGDERQTSAEGGAMIWHQQPIYTDEYGLSPAEMHAVASDELNHNASSIGSANDTPSLLSPNYPPMYEQITQQMGVMQIYDDPQMGPMQVIHPQTGVSQMEEELSECDSQSTAPIQMVSPIQIVSAAPPAPIALQATTADQILQQQTHLIPVTGGSIMPNEGSLASTQHQTQQHGDNTIESNLQTYDNICNIQPNESVTSLNEEIIQQAADSLESEYQHQPQLEQQQIQTQNMLIETLQPDYNNKPVLLNEVQDISNKSSKVTVAVTTNTDLPVERETTNVGSNKHQQQPLYQHQHSQEKNYKQQQQYVSKQSGSQYQQQQYQHQQLQTQPIPQQQQTVPITQTPQSQPQYQTSSSQHQQHQHHQPQQQHHQQQAYENRKSSQMYNQQHPSRNRKYDYHHSHSLSSSNNDNSSHQQQQSQQTTKTMSWTNSSQHKKSTNTVAVTATPSTSHTSANYNKQSNNPNSSSTHAHGTRTYTNQQHHNYQQQQNYGYQQQQHQPQTRNYGAMKMPSSPISSAPNTLERKTSQSSDKGHGHQSQQQMSQSTSTASTTAAPHQFQQPQQQQSQQTSTNDPVHTQQPSSPAANTSPSSSTTVPFKPQQQHHPSGFNNKKHSFSNQRQSGTNITTNIATAATSNNNAVETIPTPAINLAPPVTNTTPAAPSTPSWASLFANSSNAASPAIANSAAAPQIQTTTSSSSTITTTYSKKPVAKVAPYEGLTPVSPPPPVVTPGTLSYSAASAQNLPTSAPTSASAAKKAICNEQQSQRNSLANLDEYSLKFAEFLTKYKSDWATISLRPRGLTNRSNYCYINSILQALLGCSPLYNLIRSIPKQAANLCEVKTPTINAMITFMSNFSNLPSGLRLRTTKCAKGSKDDLGGDLQCDSAFEPTEIYKLWNDSREEHVEGRQEDAEEFLSYILNKLNDEMLEVIKLISKPTTEQNGRNEPPEEDGDVWQMICNNRNKGSVTRQTDFGCTPLSDIFRGELRSRLQREGELSTDVIQPFFTLQLNIEKAASVKEALEILVGRDQLEGVTGSKSKQEVVAWQQMNLEKLPPILILHLKWFDYRSDGCTKIIKKVEFPVELKIDAKILASKKYSQKQRAYRLFAVVYHDGKEATKGHYITDVYHTGYGSWLRYDDSSVKPVSENHVLLPRTPRVPYLLCYRRCDTIPQQSNNNQNNSSTGNNSSSGMTQSSSVK